MTWATRFVYWWAGGGAVSGGTVTPIDPSTDPTDTTDPGGSMMVDPSSAVMEWPSGEALAWPSGELLTWPT